MALVLTPLSSDNEARVAPWGRSTLVMIFNILSSFSEFATPITLSGLFRVPVIFLPSNLFFGEATLILREGTLDPGFRLISLIRENFCKSLQETDLFLKQLHRYFSCIFRAICYNKGRNYVARTVPAWGTIQSGPSLMGEFREANLLLTG